MSCERPFDLGNAADQPKRLACEQFKALFAGNCAARAPASHCVTPMNGRRANIARPASESCNKLKKNRGRPMLFDQHGFLTVDLTDKIKHRLRGRNSLAENEIELIHFLLNTYCHVVLKTKQPLSAPDSRMLGQLSVLAFRTVPDGQAISVASFPRWKNISLAKLPLQYKVGDEAHNRLLFKRRMKTGKTWMGYLPGVFNDEIISKMFLEIDPSTAQTTIRKYQNAHLRMSAANSFALKQEFVGMSNVSYINLIEPCFSGSWFLAPISHVREIRFNAKKNYTSMANRVVDMSRVVKKGF